MRRIITAITIGALLALIPSLAGAGLDIHTPAEWAQIAELIDAQPAPEPTWGGFTAAEWDAIAAHVATLPPAPVRVGPTLAQWEALRQCESGGIYNIASPSGKYRGAYQFDQATWNDSAPHLAGQDPAQASVVNQDAAALALWQSRGWQPWPHCGRVAAAA